MKSWTLIVIALLLTSCGGERKQETAKVSPPQTNLATPDNVLKSYWTFQVWQDTTYSMDTSAFSFYSTRVRTELANKYAKQKADLKSSPFRLRNNIDKVNIESESRAVVMTKELDYQSSDNFSERKYVLAKEQSSWLVDDILEGCWNCKGEGSCQVHVRRFAVDCSAVDVAQLSEFFLESRRRIITSRDPDRRSERCVDRESVYDRTI